MLRRWRLASVSAGVIVGCLLALPIASGRLSVRPYSGPGEWWARIRESVVLAGVPGVFFGFGRGALGVILNSAIWAATAFVLTGSNLGRPVRIAKGLTLVLWFSWTLAAVGLASLMSD